MNKLMFNSKPLRLDTLESTQQELNRVNRLIGELFTKVKMNQWLLNRIFNHMGVETVQVAFGHPPFGHVGRDNPDTLLPFRDGTTVADLVAFVTEIPIDRKTAQTRRLCPMTLTESGLILNHKNDATLSLSPVLPIGILDSSFAGHFEVTLELLDCIPPGQRQEEDTLEQSVRRVLNLDAINALIYFFSLRWLLEIHRLIALRPNTKAGYDDLCAQNRWSHRLSTLNWIVAAPPDVRPYRMRALGEYPGLIEHLLTKQSHLDWDTHHKYKGTLGTLGPYQRFFEAIDAGKPLATILLDTNARIASSTSKNEGYTLNLSGELEFARTSVWYPGIGFKDYIQVLGRLALDT
jgi:hypothetical protein